MNNFNTLIQIASFLDLHSFIEFRQVNKKFYKCSNAVQLWKNHFFQAFFGDLSMFGYKLLREINNINLDSAQVNYKDLCLARGKTRLQWMQLVTELLNPVELPDFVNELFLTLKEPFLPIPMLRKEGFYYPTLFQDLISHNESDLINGDIQEFASVFESLVKMQETMGFTYMDTNQLHEFNLARWLLKVKKDTSERDSLNSQSTSADSDGVNLLVYIMKLFLKTIKIHCKAVLGMLKSSEPGSLLPNYNLMWEVFSASACRLQSIFSPLSCLVNSLYDQKFKFTIRIPKYSPVRIMGITWIKHILDFCKDEITTEIVQKVDLLRKQKQKSENEMNTIKKSVDCLIDLSVHEFNASQIEHSKFPLSRPLQTLKSALEVSSAAYYNSLKKLPHSQCYNLLKSDLVMLSYILIPSIIEPIKSLNHQSRLASISNYYISLYNSLTNFPAFTPPHPLLYTDFGQLLFSITPSKQKIQHFLHYLSQTNNIEYVQEYNSLKLAGTTKDKEIEYKTQKTKPLTIEESLLFSLECDLNCEAFLNILGNFYN